MEIQISHNSGIVPGGQVSPFILADGVDSAIVQQEEGIDSRGGDFGDMSMMFVEEVVDFFQFDRHGAGFCVELRDVASPSINFA